MPAWWSAVGGILVLLLGVVVAWRLYDFLFWRYSQTVCLFIYFKCLVTPLKRGNFGYGRGKRSPRSASPGPPSGECSGTYLFLCWPPWYNFLLISYRSSLAGLFPAGFEAPVPPASSAPPAAPQFPYAGFPAFS